MVQFIFDTNYYREQAECKTNDEALAQIRDQRKKEIAKEHSVLFPNIVAIELIAHLLDKNETATKCLIALRLLAEHSGSREMERNKGSFMPTFHDLLSVIFFQKTTKFYTYNEDILILGKELGFSIRDSVIHEWEDRIKDVINMKQNELCQIIDNIAQLYVCSLNKSNEIDWNIFLKDKDLRKDIKEKIENGYFHKLIGLAFIKMAMQQTDSNTIPLTREYFENVFISDFRIAIDFFVTKIYANLINMKDLEKFYNPDKDSKRRWNSYFDMQLIFATEYENRYGRKTVFVTNDQKIRDCFKKNGKNDLVMSISEYQELL